MKLSVYLTVAMLMAVTIGVVAVGYFSFTFTQDALIEEIGRQQQELAHEALTLIDRTLYQKFQEIQLIADANPIEEVFISGEFTAKAEQRLGEFLLQTGPWDKLELFSVDGQEVSRQTEETSPETHDKEENTALTQALQGEVYVSHLHFSEEIGRPTIIFSAPVRDKEQAANPVIGVVIGKFSWPVILEILDAIPLKGSHIHLFNKEGVTIAAPTQHRDEILQHDLNYIPIVQQALQGSCSSSSSSSSFILEEPHQEGDQHDEHIAALSSCSLQEGYLSFKKKGWGLIVETPQNLILQPVQQLTRRILLITTLVILFFIPVIFVLSRKIIKPIYQLKDAAQKISRGNFSEKIEVKTHDEIGDLAESFDNMRYSLKMVVAEYEKMKAKEEMVRKIKNLEKKQAETIKKLRIAIAEQKIASAAEQKALARYREMVKKEEIAQTSTE